MKRTKSLERKAISFLVATLLIAASLAANAVVAHWEAAFGCPALYSSDLQEWDTAAIDEGDVAFVITGESRGPRCNITVDKKVSIDGGQTWHEEVIQCVCQNVQFKITVTNKGGSPITGVMVVDSMSECLTYEQGSATYFPDNASDNYIEWLFRGLQPGNSKEITYAAHVDCAGDLENSVSVEGECNGQIVHAEDSAVVTGEECEELCECSASETKIELMAGEEDNFDPDPDTPPASPSPTLVAQQVTDYPPVGFDNLTTNREFMHTFEWEPCGNITKACLEVKLKAIGGNLSTDRLNLLFSDDNYSINYDIWGETASTGQIETILLDLSGLPDTDAVITETTYGPVNLLSRLNDYGYLDLRIQDDTSVDYAKLILCCEQPCQWTDCGIINEVATNPANWTPGWTGTNITPEITITFQECDGDLYTLCGAPNLTAANNENITLHNYEDCQCAKYCWIEVDGKKVIQAWEALPSDECCDQCCKYCCEIDFTFIGSPVGGGDGPGGPPSLCPGEILTYEYRLTNDGSYDVECYFSDPSPAGNVYYPSPFTVSPYGTQTIYIHYQMPGNYDDTCAQPSYTFSHVLNVTIIDTDQGNVECAPIETSVHIDCHKCPEITCCNGISGLFSGENMQMKDDNGNWIPINIIPWNSNMDFGNLDDQLHDRCGAEWVYGIHDWDNPSSNHEQYKLDFTIPNGECYEIAFTACVDDAAIFRLETLDGVTEFFDTTELLTPSGTYSNFYACFESGENGEMEYCLPPGDYTLHIEHWNTEGSSYGLIFAATKCNPCVNPSISVEKKVSNDGGQTWHEEVIQCVCQNVLFQITVTNDGCSPITGVMVVDSMSECLTYEQGSATYFPDNASDNYIEWLFRSLQPGNSIEITYTAHVDCAGDLENSVSVEGECDGQVVHDEDEAKVTGKECEPCLYSGRKMEMLISGQWDMSNPSAGQWETVNVILQSEANSSAWGQRFPDLPWSYMYSGGAHWVYGNTPWDDPIQDQHEYYRLQFEVPYNGNCVELHFAAYIDDGAKFYIDGPGYTPTLFYEHDPSESIYEHDPIEFVVDIDGVPGADCLQPGDYTIYIDHWDAEGVIYGLIFVADCPPCECESCPECENEDRIIYVSSNATNTTWEDASSQHSVVEVNTPSGYTTLPLNPGCGAQWIWIGTNQQGFGWPVGTEELTTTFSIPQGYSVTTACLEISADDRADIMLNGQVVGSHEDLGGTASGWDDVSVIFISPSLFNSGTNELQVTVEDVHGIYTAGIWCLQVCLVKEDSRPCLGTILIALLLSSGLFLVSRKKKRH